MTGALPTWRFSSPYMLAAASRWTLLAKGPSFDAYERDGFSKVLGLNEVCLATYTNITHIIDIEILESIAESVPYKTDYLIIPATPHEAMKKGKHSVAHHIQRMPDIQEMVREGRVLTYDLKLGEPISGTHCVYARHCSSEAAFSLLGTAGVKDITTYGVDGPTPELYSKTFSDTRVIHTRRETLEKQDKALKETCKAYGIHWTKAPYKKD